MVHIGVAYEPEQWRVCCVERGKATELQLCEQTDAMLTAVRRLCTQYPEPTIVLALDVSMPFMSLAALNEAHLEQLLQPVYSTSARIQIKAALQALRAFSLHSYCAPAVAYLPTLPPHRLLMRSALGSPRAVCTIVALLHHMREQQAVWGEMNLFCVNIGERNTAVLVVVDGQVVNGIETLHGCVPQEVAQDVREAAFWESLTQDLAGLLAIHHIEDLVVLGQRSEKLIERLAETYQVYLFPHTHTERAGYEAALGAALLAEGLEQDGISAEVVEHLQLRRAERTVQTQEN